MKNRPPSSLLKRGLLILVAASLMFLALFSELRSSAQEEPERKMAPARMRSEQLFGAFDYDTFLEREKNGEFPFNGGDVPLISPYNSLTNNNGGATGTGFFTQSETDLLAFGNTVIVGFNDSGSNSGGTNRFTGFARSTDGGATFTDGGNLPTSPGGDAGDPVLARNDTTGRIYFSTLGFTASTIQVFRSDDNGVTWLPPVNGTPGGSSEDKQWMAVDNFPGAGNGNVYMLSRRFGAGPGIYFFRSTNHGATFGPNLGTLIVTGSQGAFIAVGPDHSIYAFWYAGTTLQVRKSIDQGTTFGPATTVASGLVGGVNGDLGLTGIRQGTVTAAGFRSNEFPHVAVNPVSGNIYVTYANNPPGTDKCDIFLVQSTNGGVTWSAPVKVNDDATTTDQWQPTIAVTPDGSRLGVFYYSRQEDPAGNNLFKYYGRIAGISGASVSFLPSFAVSDTASLPEFGRDSVINATYMGDYDHAVATAGAFHVVWADNRSDLPGGGPRKDPNVYYKTIPLGLAVTSTVPAVASVVSSVPVNYVVNFTDPIQTATVGAADFTVDGVPADSFIINSPTQVTFSYTSAPFSTEGLHTMQMAAGSILRDPDGSPLLAFNGPFRYDATLLQVVSTVPPVNGVFTLPGPFTYDVNFNEAVDPASVQAGDLQLSGIAGNSVLGVTVLPGNMTARFNINAPVEGTLTASIAAGAVTDAFGNIGAAFTGNYVVDIGTVPYPTPLLAKEPAGSLIYDPSVSGNIGFAGDTDSFTLNIDPGQTITAIATSSAGLQVRVELFDPSSASQAIGVAAGPGQAAAIQTTPAATGGVYTFTMSGAGGTTGNYTLQVILNAHRELEGLVTGSTNNTLATAADINNSFIGLKSNLPSVQRGAVMGNADNANYSAAATAFGFEDISTTGTVIAGLTSVDDASVSIPIGFPFQHYGVTNASVFVSSNGLLTFGTGNSSFSNADLTTTPSQAAIAPFWDDMHTNGGVPGSNVYFQVTGTGPNQHLTIQWNKVRFFSGGAAGDTLTFQAQLFADGRIQLNYLDIVSGSALGNNGGSATVGIKAAGTQGLNRLLLAFNNGPNAFVGTGQSTLISPPNPTPDLYSFNLNAGDITTLAVKSTGAVVASVDLLDSGGATLATGAGGPTNVDRVISNFAAGTSGTYYARVTSASSVPYNLVVTRNAAFDTEGNDSFAAAQVIDGNKGALGSIVGTGVYQGSAVTPAFEDISGTGTEITGLTGQDDASVSIPIGFPFSFYGAGNTAVFVSSNGLLTFGTGNTAFTNADLTTTPTQASIAAFWDDLIVTGTPNSKVFFEVIGAGPNQHLTIQWNQISFFTGGTAGDTLTFQVQLYADGRIQANYLDLLSGTAAGNNGASATVGVKAAGAQGLNRLLLAFNNGPNTFVGTGKSTLIVQPPGDDWYQVTLGATDTTLAYETSTPADGPGEFVNTLNPRLELYDATNTLIASGVVHGDGRNETVSATGLTPGGTYRIRVSREDSTTGEYVLATQCLLSCPSNIVVPSDPGMCGANVTLPPSTTVGSCNPVTYSPASGSFFPVGTTTVTVTAIDGTSCSFTVTVADTEPPAVSPITVASPSLWPPNHELINVGLAGGSTDNCPGATTQVLVFGDEDDETAAGDGNFSPDAKDLAIGSLRLRSERKGDGDGRVYLIVVKVTDAVGNVSFRVTTVVVPHSQSKSSVASVNAQAAAAKAYAESNGGAPPAGYFVIGDGPVIGSKQ